MYIVHVIIKNNIILKCKHKFLDNLNTGYQLTNKFRLRYRDAFLTAIIFVQGIIILKNMVIGKLYHVKKINVSKITMPKLKQIEQL